MLARIATTAKSTFKAPSKILGTMSSTRSVRTFRQEDQPRLRINTPAPDFTADTTEGRINFHEFLGNSWGILFSHPADFTPVCTTELGTFAKLKPEFDKRDVKLLGLSAEGVEKHHQWARDIEEISQLDKFSFPIVADVDREVSFLYDMVDEEGFKNLSGGLVQTIRSVYVIDPAKKIRLIFTYPASVGRNSVEVLRVVDALQLADRKGIATPIDWQKGDEVIIPPSVSDEAAAEKFGEFRTVKPYLRYTKAD
ncbi:AaceriAGR368Wp [[Ashbya] aceris (nom. inval.)]|nr:AaceriAGR368Wp [[Ashbya] aceris (nom. inval.)]